MVPAGSLAIGATIGPSKRSRQRVPVNVEREGIGPLPRPTAMASIDIRRIVTTALHSPRVEAAVRPRAARPDG